MEVKDLKPALIWQCFDEITKVPRPSCHEEQIREYLLDFAKKNNIEAKTDDCGNVVMTKAATAGCENAPTVILQAHMDMVAEKNNDVEHDFLKDPIQTYIDGEWVKAKGTTLGADNGIGMAGALAVLLDNTLEHGKVECLFTINEEIGLEGAQNLGKDMITGSMLINLDSEDDGEIFVGCAGGIDTTAYFNYTPVAAPEDLCYVKVAISGLLGGHSGSDINTGRGNANKLIARFVWNISKDIELKLASFDGGNLRNAIPREAHAIIGVAADKKAEIEARLAEYTKEIENEYKGIEPVVKFTLEAVERPAFIVDDATAKALILSLYSAPHGVYSMSRDLEGLVETSTNLAAVKFIDGNKIKVTTSQRSSVESRKHDIAAQVETHFLLAGAEIDHSDGYPGWAPNMDSTI
ncbi:MAG: beta-Ala-His dipeptidase, partial [Muribaculaceae bacterium]|nr:beta-Ala-His dipeptidase [Muribaculaceae bacterium]